MPCAENEFSVKNLLGDQDPMWYDDKASKTMQTKFKIIVMILF